MVVDILPSYPLTTTHFSCLQVAGSNQPLAPPQASSLMAAHLLHLRSHPPLLIPLLRWSSADPSLPEEEHEWEVAGSVAGGSRDGGERQGGEGVEPLFQDPQC